MTQIAKAKAGSLAKAQRTQREKNKQQTAHPQITQIAQIEKPGTKTSGIATNPSVGCDSTPMKASRFRSHNDFSFSRRPVEPATRTGNSTQNLCHLRNLRMRFWLCWTCP
jgi:hypothetical protein